MNLKLSQLLYHLNHFTNCHQLNWQTIHNSTILPVTTPTVMCRLPQWFWLQKWRHFCISQDKHTSSCQNQIARLPRDRLWSQILDAASQQHEQSISRMILSKLRNLSCPRSYAIEIFVRCILTGQDSGVFFILTSVLFHWLFSYVCPSISCCSKLEC